MIEMDQEKLRIYHKRFLTKDERKLATIADVDHANTDIETEFDANEQLLPGHDFFKLSKAVESLVISGQTPSLQNNSMTMQQISLAQHS